jgi:hypothetical protein
VKRKILALVILTLVLATAIHFNRAQGGYNPVILPPISVNLQGAVIATGTFTSQSVPMYGKTFDTVITYAAITGAPLTCTLQQQISADNVNFINNGTAVALAPANGTSLVTTTGIVVGAYNKFIYACATYPTGGTITLNEVFHSS